MQVVSVKINRKSAVSNKSYDLTLSCGHTMKWIQYRTDNYLCWCEKRYALGTIGVSGTGFSVSDFSNEIEPLKVDLIPRLKSRVQPWVVFLIQDRKTLEYVYTEKAREGR